MSFNDWAHSHSARRFTKFMTTGTAVAVAAMSVVVLTSGPASSATSKKAAGLARAEAATIAAEKTPTTINQTVPLKEAPPKGKTVVFIQDDISSSGVLGQGVEQGVTAAGWHFKELSYVSANPATLVTAMQQALQYHPFSVSFAGEPESVWASEIPAYAAAGVKIIPTTIGPQALSGPVKADIGNFAPAGVNLGNWFIANSKGEGHVLLFNLPTFPVLTQEIIGFKKAVSENCPDCVETSYNGTLADLGSGQIVPNIVTAVKKDPSVKYIMTSDFIFTTGLSSALSAAGLTGIKIIGVDPEPSDFQEIRAGTESAAGTESNIMLGWVVADTNFRLAEGMKVPGNDGGQPTQVLTAANVGIASKTEPANFESLFRKLWKLK